MSSLPWVAEVYDLLGAAGVREGQLTERAYDCDAYTVDRSAPTLVAMPKTTEEAAALIQICARHGVPVTPRGAGTGLSGGATPALGGVVLSTTHMRALGEPNQTNRTIKAGAGVPNVAITEAVAQLGLHFAPDPSSQAVSTLGGNIAENSGGPHTLKMGVTAQHILGVTFIDDSGEVVTIGGGVRNPPWPDFSQLVIGSEGTLGLVSEAVCNLAPSPLVIQTALAAFKTVSDATGCVSEIIATGLLPAAMEIMDAQILVALKAAFGLEFPEGTAALLLVECDGDQEPVVEAEMKAVAQAAQNHEAMTFETAKTPQDRLRLWTARKKGVGAMGRLARSIVTHDGVIPRSKLPEMLDFVYATAQEAQIGVANLFHAGDGNLHPCFFFDDRDPAQVKAVVEAGEKILKKCVELGGSLTGEHGIGFEKADLLGLMYNADDLKLQRSVQEIFCKTLLLNPCKVLPLGKGCSEHRSRWRGAAW